MTLKRRGKWWHASSAADLDEYLLRHVLGRHCDDLPHRVTHAVCAGCSGTTFDLFKDPGDRIVRICTACKTEHNVCDIDEMCDADSAREIVCTCMYSECEIAVGFALMDPPEGGTEEDGPVGHLYVAGRCIECGLCGVYSEWGPEGDYTFPELAKYA